MTARWQQRQHRAAPWPRRLVYLMLALALLAGVSWLVYAFTPLADLEVAGYSRGGYVDLHTHAACIEDARNGCFVSERLLNSYKFPFYLNAFGVSEEELREHGSEIVVERLSQQVSGSEQVSRAVVLALDGVIKHGKLDRQLTELFVPNDFVARAIEPYDNLLFGASVNPYRPDALKRLRRVKAQGAVLIKWIPGIMHIDPSDRELIPFYDLLVELDLALLTHTGQERAFSMSRDELADPVRLRLPLERGVTVIAAHVASTGENDGVEDFLRLLPLFDEYPNLYADISSLTQINKLGYLARTLALTHAVDRLVFGTDWPLQFFPLVSPWYQIRDVPPAELKAITAIPNVFDRDVALKKAMGTPEAVFERTAKVLKLR